MTKELESAIRHIKTRADAWAVKEVTDALQDISERIEPCDKYLNKDYSFGNNKGVMVWLHENDNTVTLPEATFKYILSLIPAEKESEE